MDTPRPEDLGRLKLEHGMDPFLILQAKAHLRGMRTVDLVKHAPTRDAISRVSAEICRCHRVVPVAICEDSQSAEVLVVAIADPENVVALDAVRMACGTKIQPVLASQEQLEAAINEICPRTD